MIFMQQIQINNVIFGFRFDTPENNLLNFIIMIVKKYIYNCRCKEIKPCFEVALLEIKKYYKISCQILTQDMLIYGILYQKKLMYCKIIDFKCDCIFYVGVLAWVMHACYLV